MHWAGRDQKFFNWLAYLLQESKLPVHWVWQLSYWLSKSQCPTGTLHYATLPAYLALNTLHFAFLFPFSWASIILGVGFFPRSRLINCPRALTAVRARRIKIWGRCGTGPPSLAKVVVYFFHSQAALGDFFPCSSPLRLILTWRIRVFTLTSVKKANSRRSRQENLLGYSGDVEVYISPYKHEGFQAYSLP
jgi:hypothetical protein